MSYYIYKLKIGEYWYIGSSNNKRRFYVHKGICCSPNNKGYNLPVYKKIRELTNDFYRDVKFTKLHYRDTKKEAECKEDELIDLSNPYCLNTYRANQDNRKNKILYRKKKYYCGSCDKMEYLTHKARHERTKKHIKGCSL